jgi:hypothetical protein
MCLHYLTQIHLMCLSHLTKIRHMCLWPLMCLTYMYSNLYYKTSFLEYLWISSHLNNQASSIKPVDGLDGVKFFAHTGKNFHVGREYEA